MLLFYHKQTTFLGIRKLKINNTTSIIQTVFPSQPLIISSNSIFNPIFPFGSASKIQPKVIHFLPLNISCHYPPCKLLKFPSILYTVFILIVIIFKIFKYRSHNIFLKIFKLILMILNIYVYIYSPANSLAIFEVSVVKLRYWILF